ncbi:hypothetical protein GP486_008123, partial [Trichoglossum hirsutum]
EDPVAKEVYVTGTFNDWKITIPLEKEGNVFQKSVELPLDQRVLYKASHPVRIIRVFPPVALASRPRLRPEMKCLPPRLPASPLLGAAAVVFVVDDKWVTDSTAPEVTGEDGITNNILPPEKITRADPTMSQTDPGSVTMSTVTPSSTTAELAKGVPLEKNTRGNEATQDATISSAAPDSSTANLARDVPLERKTTPSGIPGTFPQTPQREPSDVFVKPLPATDGPGNPIHLKPGEKVPDSSSLTANTVQSTVHDDDELKKESEDLQQTVRVSPLPATAGIGNPIHLKPGEPVPDPSTFTKNTITSTVTTDEESFNKSGSALSGPPAEPSATAAQDEQGPGLLDLPPVTKNMIPESSLPIGGDTTAPGTDPGVTISSAAPTSTTAALAAKVPLEPKHAEGTAKKSSDEVPEVVKESISKAHVDPEATANPEAVHEKKEVEDEFMQKVKHEEGAARPFDRPITPESPTQPESGDVSPMTKPAAAPAQTEPTVTSGDAKTTTDKATGPPQTSATSGNGGGGVKNGTAESSQPSTDKKKKRFSWLGKMKEKLHLDKDKDKDKK